ncbi:MAG: hypothetical protein ACFCVC_08280 [Acidimicrobiia bacterium]
MKQNRVLIWAVGLLGASVVGAVASLFRDEGRLLAGLVFGVMTLGPMVGLATIFFARTEAGPRHETVEKRWMLEATSGAWGDLVMGLGVFLAVVSIAGLDFGLEPIIVLVAAMASAALRYWLLARAAE